MLDLLSELDLDAGSRLRILDIGSGPLSFVGDAHDTYDIDLTVVDPLATE